MPIKIMPEPVLNDGSTRRYRNPFSPKPFFPSFKGLKKGYVQVYTGDGECKSTAAFGLTRRASGIGTRL